MIHIAVDAHGSEHGSGAEVAGALLGARDPCVHILLCGEHRELSLSLSTLSDGDVPRNIEIVDARNYVSMHTKVEEFMEPNGNFQNSSMMVALQLVRSGKADAFVSMGNSACAVYGSWRLLRPIKRGMPPCLAIRVPITRNRVVFLLDVGAYTDPDPERLAALGWLGRAFAKACGVAKPTVKLLTNGEEPGKGSKVTQDTYKLLENQSWFMGNTEGNKVLLGTADVVLMGGEVGNVFLKATTGGFKFLFAILREEAKQLGLVWKALGLLGFVLAIPALLVTLPVLLAFVKGVKGKLDRNKFGSLVASASKPAVVGHADSGHLAVASAIHFAKWAVTHQVTRKIAESLEEIA